MTSGSFKEWAANKLFKFIRAKGTLVPKEIRDKRLDICRKCVNFVKVEPLPGLVGDGCRLCGCPFATKGWMRTIPRLKGRETDPISIDEMLRIMTHDPTAEFVETTIICPNEGGDLWANL